MSPLVVGLTIVSFATSAPELAVTLGATFSGSPGLAIGNVVGSNIANILLVLGASALTLPLLARAQLVRSDIPIMIGMSVLVLLLALDGEIGRLDGALLLGLLVAYVVRLLLLSRRPKDGRPRRPVPQERAPRPALDLVLVGGGVGLLVLGARLLVDSATGIAAAFGVSDLIIGLTVVAVGTSLPELATSVIAALRGERELAIGNVVGSNIFNIGSVLGLTALISPGAVPVEAGAVGLDIPVMVVVALALLPVAFTGAAIERWEGGVFLAYYAAYVGYLVLDSTGHDSLALFSTVLLGFAAPLTALTVVVVVGHELRRRSRGAGGAASP